MVDEYVSRRAAETDLTRCICPKCKKKHIKRTNYTGRPPARFACDKCSRLFREPDPGELRYWAYDKLGKI